MTNIDTTNFVDLPAVVADTNRFFFPASDVILHIYAKDKYFVQPAYEAMKKEAKDYDVYKPSETPIRWHYTNKDDHYNRIGDLILVPKWPKIFNIRKRKPMPSAHGFDNALPDMQASFYAWGPAFKQNMVIPPFENVHVYPLIAKILGLTIHSKIDGNLNVLLPVLR
jgi:predicted AlkP superfamily pyrophosphatase or phosphodiesterase